MASLQQVALEPQLLNRAAPSLRTNFKWTLAGGFVYALCQWGMLSVLAKAGSAGIVGQFALGLAVSAPIFMFTNLQLRAVQATDARREYQFSDYFTLRMFTTTAGLVAIATVTLAFHLYPTTRWVILLVALAKSIESISDVIGGLLQFHERLDQVAISFILRGGFSIVSFGATFLWLHSLVVSVAAMCVAWMAVLLGYDLRRARTVLPACEPFIRVRWQTARRLFVLSLPLGLVMTLMSLNTNTPRYLLERYSGAAELGILASLAYLMVALNLIVNALCQSATTRLSRLFSEGKVDDFCRILLKLASFGVLVVVAGVPTSILFGRRLLTILYRPEYGDHVSTLAILTAASGVSSTAFFITSGLNAARRFRAQFPVFACSALATVLSCLFLIPRYGLNGAATALLIASVVSLIGNLWLLLSTLKLARASAGGTDGLR